MKTFFETIAVGFSIFSSVKMPQVNWNEKNMRYMLLVFPFVGTLTGIICVLWCVMADYFSLPDILLGAGLTIIPVMITGGIHLDGYADTCDALASHKSPDEKVDILHDPHTGAFAIIRVCAYFVLIFAVWSVYTVDEYFIIRFILLFTISRILSGISVVSFDRTKREDLLHVFYDYSDPKTVRIVLIIFDCLAVALFCMTGITGVLMATTAHLVFIYYHRQCKREFGGVSGDQAGWFLVQAEKWMAIVMVTSQFVLPKIPCFR